MADELTPITRLEGILAGRDITPITRLEYFLKQYAGGGGSGGGSPLIVRITDNGDGTGESDKTFAQIRAAFEQSRQIFSDYGGSISPLFPERFYYPDGTLDSRTPVRFKSVYTDYIIDNEIITGINVTTIRIMAAENDDGYTMTVEYGYGEFPTE